MVYIEKVKKILIIICIAALLTGCFSITALAAEPFEPQSPAVLVAELTSDTVLLSKNPELSINPGSIAKLTALYVIARECFEGNVSLSDEITITQDVMVRDSGQIPLKGEEIFTLEQLMYLMYMDYSDTAANAAAVHVAGNMEAFIGKMNSAVSEMGCTGTHFVNMTGAFSDEQKTTPEDLLIILKSAMQNSIFMNVFTTASYTVKDTNKSISRSMGTPNLLQRPNSEFYVRNCRGGRLGGFKESGYATISLSSASDSGMELVVITAGNPDFSGSYSDASGIVQWTFDNFSWQTIIKAGESLTKVPVDMGSGTDYVVAGADKDISILIDNDISVLDFQHDITIYSEENGKALVAPISRGDVLGELTLSYGGKEYGTVTLVANQDVELMRWEYFKSEIRSTLRSSGIIWCIIIVCIMLVCYIAYSVLFWYRHSKKRRELEEVKMGIIHARRGGSTLVSEQKAVIRVENEVTVEQDKQLSETADAANTDFDEYPLDAEYEILREDGEMLKAENSEKAESAEVAEYAESCIEKDSDASEIQEQVDNKN